MMTRRYLRLPIDPDEGFPQAFQLAFEGRSYDFFLYVNVLETDDDVADDHIYDLPAKGAYLVMDVSRVGAGSLEPLFRRKLVPNLEYEAGELAFFFARMRVARRNLNGFGTHGSEVVGGIAAR